jgi:Domain of unknown function (DUF4267)
VIDPASLPAILSDAAGAGLVAVGALGVAFPAPLAHSFGMPLNDKSAVVFVRATGVRDLALGAVLLAASLRSSGDVLLVAVIACLVISLADFFNAFFGGDRVLHRQHAVHILGAALFAAILALLLPLL